MSNELSAEIFKRLQLKNENISKNINSNDINAVLHELDVFESELLAQNEELQEKETLLEEAKEEYQHLFSKAPVLYIVVDERLNIVKYNIMADTYFRFSSLKKNITPLLSYLHKNTAIFLEFIKKDISFDESSILEFYGYNKSILSKFKVQKDLYRHNQENYYLLVLTNLDKEQKQLEEIQRLDNELKEKNHNLENQKEFLNLVFDTLPYCVITSKVDEMISVNSATLRFFGFASLEELKSQQECIYDFFIEKEGYVSKNMNGLPLLDYILQNEGIHKALIIKEGKSYTFEVDVTSFTTNNEDIYLIVLYDITEKEMLIEDMQDALEHDQLTKIYNRTVFNERIKLYLEMNKRKKLDITLAMIDIDFFKKVNDRYGHLVGDNVLIQLSHHINVHIRKIDFFARWGGEEFALILYDTDLSNAKELIEKLRQSIEKLQIHKVGTITCSFGLTQMKNDDSLEKIVQRCDAALYEAKLAGRNQVVSI